MFTANYPLPLKHIIREAKLYRECLMKLEGKGCLCLRGSKEKYFFWNQIMMEHALFIRGLLDPEESELMETADNFAKEYATLLAEAKEKNDCTMNGLLMKTKELTRKYQEFKTAGTKGISNCEISSIILPFPGPLKEQPKDFYSRMIPLQGAVSIENKFDMELEEGASCPGDYLYRSGSLKWDVESGMWGIFRVVKEGIKHKCWNKCRKLATILGEKRREK